MVFFDCIVMIASGKLDILYLKLSHLNLYTVLFALTTNVTILNCIVSESNFYPMRINSPIFHFSGSMIPFSFISTLYVENITFCNNFMSSVALYIDSSRLQIEIKSINFTNNQNDYFDYVFSAVNGDSLAFTDSIYFLNNTSSNSSRKKIFY